MDSRALTIAEQQRVDAALRSLKPQNSKARLLLHGGINRPPMQAEQAAGLFHLAAKVAEDLGHSPLQSIAVGGSSDGNFTAGLGVPTLDGLGSVGGGSHATDEHALTEWFLPRIDLVAGLVQRLLDT